MAMATATKVLGDKEGYGEGGKGDGDGDKGRGTVTATKRAIVTAKRVADNKREQW
jgi:hypothetical protein